MEPEATTTTQHKRGSETSSYNLRPRGATAAHAVIAPAQTFAKSQKTDRTTKTVTSAVLEACREAFPYRPAASIACLTKNQTSIDLTLVEIIETVDSSKNKVTTFPNLVSPITHHEHSEYYFDAMYRISAHACVLLQ